MQNGSALPNGVNAEVKVGLDLSAASLVVASIQMTGTLNACKRRSFWPLAR
jgi:hypothetical protein